MDILILRLVGAATLAVALGGCATVRPYMYSDLETPIAVTGSEYHRISYVRAYEDDGELVVYGKVEHSHGYCPTEGHVDLAMTDRYGKTVQAESLPLRVGSPKQHGWYGASFRTKFKGAPAVDSRLSLAIHDAGCRAGATFDCGENVAATAAPPPEPADPR